MIPASIYVYLQKLVEAAALEARRLIGDMK